ncbi:SDR family NAD(P)-dependent oxidoreductase [Nocardia sp. NPDC049707]|uniref:SDR family NAD(P)-dependent oxidoreductase n=1 Tax=Nocardia sp. NPDC049707 TaxID=3154735 RepID=UPI0034167ACF
MVSDIGYRTAERPPQALMTGASTGIGRAFAISLAAAGYSVTAVARRQDALDDLLAELGNGHDRLAADLADPVGLAVVDRARKALSDKAGPVVLTSRANRLTTGALRPLPRRASLALLAD